MQRNLAEINLARMTQYHDQLTRMSEALSVAMARYQEQAQKIADAVRAAIERPMLRTPALWSPRNWVWVWV